MNTDKHGWTRNQQMLSGSRHLSRLKLRKSKVARMSKHVGICPSKRHECRSPFAIVSPAQFLIRVHPCPSVVSILFSFLFLCGLPCFAASAPDFSEAATILKQGIADRAYPGCAVAVGTKDKILWSAAFGFFDYEDTTAVATNTIYDLASLTKVTGTTSVFMRLVEKGKVRISDPASKYLPEIVDLAEGDAEKAKRRKITIEHLLTHTAGLGAGKRFAFHSHAKLVQAICRTSLEAEPGAHFRYSDFGMILLGEIAARAGGKPLLQLERELVFDPLGMTDTMRNPPASLIPRITPTEIPPGGHKPLRGVVHDENSHDNEGITGHAGLFSTTGDLSKLAAELLRALDGHSKIFSQAVVADFARPHPMGTNSNRGLGWGFTDSKNSEEKNSTQRALYHTGFTGTSMEIELDRKLFIILLTNRVHPTRDNNKISRVRRDLPEAVMRAFDQSVTK